MFISFAWTIDALVRGEKTVTRRIWKDEYASRFHLGMLIDAYDKLPHAGGKKIGTIRITREPYKQFLRDMPDEHFDREGIKTRWANKSEFIYGMGGPDAEFWVIEFELIEIQRNSDKHQQIYLSEIV